MGGMHTIGAEGALKLLGLRHVRRRTIFQAGAQGSLNCGVGTEASDISAVKGKRGQRRRATLNGQR